MPVLYRRLGRVSETVRCTPHRAGYGLHFLICSFVRWNGGSTVAVGARVCSASARSSGGTCLVKRCRLSGRIPRFSASRASHPATTRRRSRVTRLRSEMQHAARGRSRDKRVINRRRSSLNCVIRSHDERGADTTSCKRYRNGKQGQLPAWLCGSGRPMPPRVMATIHVGHASFGLDPPNARVSFTHASSRGARARERAGPPTQTPPSRRCYHSLQDALCSTAAAGAAADA